MGTFHFYRGAQREEAVGITFWCRYRAGELASSGEHDQALWVSPTEAKKLVAFRVEPKRSIEWPEISADEFVPGTGRTSACDPKADMAERLRAHDPSLPSLHSSGDTSLRPDLG